MHELGITRNIVAIVIEQAQGRKVRGVTLEIGRLSGVMSDAVAFCFDVVAQGTALEGAALTILDTAGRARCQACAAEFDLPRLGTPCACGSHRVTLLRGEELMIKSMELEEAA